MGYKELKLLSNRVIHVQPLENFIEITIPPSSPIVFLFEFSLIYLSSINI